MDEYKNEERYFCEFNTNDEINTSVRDFIEGNRCKVALVAIAKDEDHYLKEWVDYHLKIGFSEIFVYQNDWEYKNGDINDPRVHLEHISGVGIQNKCYNDFINKNYEKYDFIAFFDIDEFLWLRNKNDVKDFL